MDRIIGSVYETHDYSVFKRLDGNRSLLNRRKENLIKSFSEGEVFNPIVVNKNMEIIDGQGRFEAKKELGLPIYYVIDANAGLQECQRMNAYNSKWTVIDFVESYANEGNEDYARLLNTHRESKIAITNILDLGGLMYHTRTDYLKRGTIKYSKEDDDNVRHIIKSGYQIKDALDITTRVSNTYWLAMRVIVNFDGYNHERMLKNCKLCRNRFVMANDLEGCLKELSKVYNYNIKNTSNRLFFEDYMRNRGYNVRNYDHQCNFKQEAEDVSSLKADKRG